MNKKSHLIFTGQMNAGLPAVDRIFLQMGCILPDILVHTYLRGHTWETSGKKVLGSLEMLEDWGIFSAWSSLCLGMVLHYVEDYFTMAHSRYFTGSIWEHVQYETKLLKYLKEYDAGNKSESHAGVFTTEMQSETGITEYIVQLQNAYQKEIAGSIGNETQCFETDIKYMTTAVQTLLDYVIPRMNRNTVVYRKLVGEAMARMPQEFDVIF